MKMNELPVPDAVLRANQSMEMARIWIIDGHQVITFSPNLWSDPGSWGLMFVDMARHLSKQYAQAGKSEAEVLSRIRTAFDAEWSHATGKPGSPE